MARQLPRHIKDAPFIRLDANFCDDERIREVGERAAWLYLAMACEARRRRADGTLPSHVIPRLGVKAWAPRLATLIRVGLVEQDDDTYRIPGYLKWNPSQKDYERIENQGRVGGCVSKHPQPCDKPSCKAARQWLHDHPE